MARSVLVVDDESLILELVASMLKDLGCEVVTATDAIGALAKLKADKRIEMLITDINMPGMSGYQLVEKARERRADLKVIMLSGQETDGHGFPLVRKPFTQQDLARTMEQTAGAC